MAEDLEQKSIVWNQKLTQEFVDDLAHEKLANGHIRGRQSAEHVIRYSPYESDVAASRFLQKKEHTFMLQHHLPTMAQLEKKYPKIEATSLSTKIAPPSHFEEQKQKNDGHEQRLEAIKIKEPPIATTLESEKQSLIKTIEGSSGSNLAKNSSALSGKIISEKRER